MSWPFLSGSGRRSARLPLPTETLIILPLFLFILVKTLINKTDNTDGAIDAQKTYDTGELLGLEGGGGGHGTALFFFFFFLSFSF
jgi:hypothetical protein